MFNIEITYATYVVDMQLLWASIHFSNGYRMLRVRGYMEMPSMCNLINVQMMHVIYIKW